MTNEEARVWLEHHFDPLPDGTKQSEAVSLAIKALEQEPVFDKIRAEIEQMDFDFGDFYDHTCTIREMVLEVIDKYKVERENKG